MILGIGTDIVNISRIKETMQKHGSRFASRILCASEQDMLAQLPDAKKIPFIAKRFAAKEAFVKALSTGFQEGVRFQDIEILKTEAGAPYIKVYNRALEILNDKLPRAHTASIFLSLSDDMPYAQAFVVLEAVPSS